MIFISGTKDFRLENTAVAIGKFDGLHRGHQTLLEKISSYDMTSVLLTFDYHPASMLDGRKPQLIYTSEERRILAARMGVDVLIEYPFTRETADMTAADFIRNVLKDKLGAMHIVVGEDFRFGAHRQGDARLLEGMSLPLGYVAHICPKVHTDLPPDFAKENHDVDIGATLIRKAISQGRIELANEMLGNPYSIFGTVVHGREIGRTIGMPTANIEPDETKLLPPNGVYASTAVIDHRVFPAVTNIGRNPTVASGQKCRAETFVYGFDGNLYDRMIEVKMYHYQRPERKFDGVDALKAQMHNDMENSWKYLKTEGII